MDSMSNATNSLIFRITQSEENSAGKGLRKTLMTPQGRLLKIMKSMIQGLSNGKLRAAQAIRLLDMLRKAIRKEQETLSEQLSGKSSTDESLSLRQMAIGSARLGQAVDECLASLHEGTREDFNQAAATLTGVIVDHERMMESIVSTTETEGWLLMQRFRGPFSPFLGVMGCGITHYLSGDLSHKNFSAFLDGVERELLEKIKSFRPTLFFGVSWRQAEREALKAFLLVKFALTNREALANGVIDPTSLRGALGAFAKTLCHLNVLAASLHPAKAAEELAYSAGYKVYVNGKKPFRHILSLADSFYPSANPAAAN